MSIDIQGKKMVVVGGVSREAASAFSDTFPETADIETSSEDYASRFSGALGEWLLSVQEKATLKMLAEHPKATVLEVGGGHGQLTPALIQNGFNVTVLGSDDSCKHRILPYIEAGQCQFQVGNVLALPYDDNSFDIVMSFRFLAHVNQWEQFLSELARVAKTAVILDYPTTQSFNAIAPLLFNFKKGVEQNTRPYVSYEEKQLLNHLKTLGLKPQSRYAQFFWPMLLHRMGKSPALSSTLEAVVRPLGLTNWLGSPVILKCVKNSQA